MQNIEKMNIACVVEYNGNHYLKNIVNGCTVELNDQYYADFESRKDYVLQELDNIGFFSVRKSNTVDLMIMLSSACNLSCSYCFEKNKKDHQIQPETIANIISFLKNNLTANTSSLNITFTGGEPLIATSEMYCLTGEIKRLCEHVGVSVNFSIITNGTLIDDEILAFFDTYNFEVQITLDGQRELHNRIRYFNDRTGTFDSILTNIDMIYSMYKNVHVTIRVNISTPDFEVYIPLFEELFDRFPRFDVYIDFLDVLRSSDLYMNDFEKIAFYSKFLLLMKKHNRMHVRNYFEGGNCMIRNDNSLTIDSDGRIYKCYSLVGDSLYAHGSICDFVDCQVSAIPPMVGPCSNTSCVFYHLCYGGCPYKRYVVDNALDNFCITVKPIVNKTTNASLLLSSPNSLLCRSET